MAGFMMFIHSVNVSFNSSSGSVQCMPTCVGRKAGHHPWQVKQANKDTLTQETGAIHYRYNNLFVCNKTSFCTKKSERSELK